MGIIFNTHDVGVCLAEEEGVSAMMRVLFLIPVMCEMSESTRKKVYFKIAWVLILIPVMCGCVLLR